MADLHSTYAGALFVGGFGVLIIAAGTVGYVYGWRKLKLREWLDQNGREIWVPAEHTRVRITSHDDRNRPSFFVLQAAWVDPIMRRTICVDSDFLREDPSELVRSRGRVRVLSDSADPTRNRIDFDQKPHAEQF